MIEIVMDKERNLKNLKQIGTPREDNKIYIENLAYSKIREGSYQDKRIFVLMGHTERMEGRYATFVEAVIPVKDAEFMGSIPQWNNGMWSQVFREIKRIYEDMIIVGWAIDVRGMSPSITPELERVHREHFGGVHQVLFLVDSLEKEETFYIYKENKLISKDGFYIYYRARRSDNTKRQAGTGREERFQVIDLNKEKPDEDSLKTVNLDFDSSDVLPSSGGRYRQMMKQKEQPSESGNGGLAIAVAMLVFLIVVGAYENRDAILGSQEAVSTEAGASTEAAMSTETGKSTETGMSTEAGVGESTETMTESNTEASAAPGYVIPVEGIPEAGNGNE